MIETSNNMVPICVDDRILSQIIETTPDPIFILEQSGRIKLANSKALMLLGFTQEELIDKNFESLVQSEALHEEDDFVRKRLHTLKLKKKNGACFAAEASFSSFTTNDGKYISVSIRDVGRRKHLETELRLALDELTNTNNKLRRLCEIDHLTEALNRRGLEQILKRESERMSRDGTVMCVSLIDVDDFKAVNEKFGHSVGDDVLKEIALRAKRSLRSTDYFARIGGDEFMILFPSTDLQDAALVSERVRNAISDNVMPHELFITVSGGVVQLPMRLHTLEEILPLLRNALKKSKTEGKNCVCVGNAKDLSIAVKPYSSSELNFVLEHGLYTDFDIICSLEEKMAKGIELLIRGPKDSLHSPAEILQAAQEMDMLTQADLACAEVCAKAAEDRKDHLPFHLNILPSTLESVPSDRLLEILCGVMKSRLVCLELSVLRINTEPGYLIDPVKELKEQGIQIALDDVCYGRSSLEALIVLEPTFIKLDEHFISGISRDVRKQNAVKRLLKMSRVVGAEVIAGGIETVEDCDALKELGVSLGQGFLFSSRHNL